MWLNTAVSLLALIALVQCHIIAKEQDSLWWEHATFYQVYPRSFKDSNNDGDGDLKGITSKLPELKELGIDAIWLSPIMKSPQVDQGYDISDYRDIDPMYGNMKDFDALLDAAHKIGLKVILDFVPNHTSDKHEWFLASVNGTEEYKDFYVWVDGEKGTPPNNWISLFFNSAWEWNEQRQQYYLHQFAVAQPDLNYTNPKVRQAMKDVLSFWLDKGVDGFRIDAVPTVAEDPQLRDEPKSNLTDDPNDPEYLNHIYTQNLPLTYEIVYEWRKLLDKYTSPPRVIMTEVYAEIDQVMQYYGSKDGKTLGAHFCFNFFLIKDLNINSTAADVVRVVKTWLDNIPDIYTSNWVLGNHDQHRVATRLGAENVDGFNMLSKLLPGVGVAYNGEEIGMENGEVTFEEGKDPSARNRSLFEKVSRDFERTPYQWDDTTNAGFNTGAKTWLPVSEKYHDVNLAKQKSDEDSHYSVFNKLMSLRKSKATLTKNADIRTLSDDVVLLDRWDVDSHLLQVFKIGHSGPETVAIKSKCEKAVVSLASVGSEWKKGNSVDLKKINLKPHESLVLECNA